MGDSIMTAIKNKFRFPSPSAKAGEILNVIMIKLISRL